MPELPLEISEWLLWKRREINLKYEKNCLQKKERRGMVGSVFGDRAVLVSF